MDFNHYRKLFPVTNDAIYLNHAAIAPLSLKVQQTIQSFLLKRGGMMPDLESEIENEITLLKKNIARLTGADKDRIAAIETANADQAP